MKRRYTVNGDKNFYVIKALSMANYLVRCGHDIRGVSKNDKNPNFYVFLFEDSVKLQIDMSKYKKINY